MTKEVCQEFLAIDRNSGMVVGKMLLWRMEQSSTMGGWDQAKLGALKFLPVEENLDDVTLTALPCKGCGDVDMAESENNVEIREKEEVFQSEEKQVVPQSLKSVKLSFTNMYADPKEVKNALKRMKLKPNIFQR